jgi:DNA gyrase inhibitor GyrI
MPTILNRHFCFDNSMNRVRIIEKLSNNTRNVIYKTPINGGPYSVFSYIISEEKYNKTIRCIS